MSRRRRAAAIATTTTAVAAAAAAMARRGRLSYAHACSQGLIERALEGKEATVGKAHPSTLGLVCDLAALVKERHGVRDHKGIMVDSLGRAEELYRRALRGKEAALGYDHPSTVRTRSELGNVVLRRGNAEEVRSAVVSCSAPPPSSPP